MAITIILPEYLEPNAERVVFASLKNFGAERISAKEWRFNLIPLSQQEFVAEFTTISPYITSLDAGEVQVQNSRKTPNSINHSNHE